MEIFANDGLPYKTTSEKDAYAANLANKYGSDFRDQIFFAEENGRKVGFLGKQEELFKELKSTDKSFLLDQDGGNGMSIVRQTEILNRFREKMEYFKLCEKNATTFKGNILVSQIKDVPDWANNDKANYLHVFNGNNTSDINREFKFEEFTIRVYFEWFEGEVDGKKEQMDDKKDTEIGLDAAKNDTSLNIQAKLNFKQKL